MEELQRPRTPEPVRAWMTSPLTWLQIRAPHQPLVTTTLCLGAGKRETLSLAQELQSYLVLLDDLEARETYRNFKLHFAPAPGAHPPAPPTAPPAGGSSHAPRAAPPPRRSAPAPGAARLALGLDMRLRMGERSASGVPWGDGFGKSAWDGGRDGVLRAACAWPSASSRAS